MLMRTENFTTATAAPVVEQRHVADWAVLVGRIALAAIYLWSGYGKLADIGGNVAYMNAHHMPFAQLLIWPAALFELIAGALIVFGWATRWAALLLAAYTVVAALIFHNFWAVPPTQALNQMIHFMKNIAIAGGFLVLYGFGPGRYSADRE